MKRLNIRETLITILIPNSTGYVPNQYMIVSKMDSMDNIDNAVKTAYGQLYKWRISNDEERNIWETH